MSNNVELLIPYYRCQSSLLMLLKSVRRFSSSVFDITIIASEESDFDVEKFCKETSLNINYINTNILNQDERMYSYLSDTLYDKSIVIHTDIEIIEHDPILEILKLSEIDSNIGMIGKLMPGRFSSNYEEYLKPSVSSHFCFVNNKLMQKFIERVSSNSSISEFGFFVGGRDLFPSGAYHYASYKGVQCLNLPKSIESKVVHFNSTTRRDNINHGLVQNDNSIRVSQLDVISGVLNLRHGLKYSESLDNIVIIGLGDDAIDTFNMVSKNYENSNIYFCERFSTVHGQLFKGKKVLSFNESTHLNGKVFFYICTPDYRWFADKLIFAGLRYGVDYRVRLVHGNDFIQSEFTTFFPGDNNDIAVLESGVMLPNNNFIDSSQSGYLSAYHLYKYSIALFFVVIRKPIDWVLAKKRAAIGLTRFKSAVKNVK